MLRSLLTLVITTSVFGTLGSCRLKEAQLLSEISGESITENKSPPPCVDEKIAESKALKSMSKGELRCFIEIRANSTDLDGLARTQYYYEITENHKDQAFEYAYLQEATLGLGRYLGDIRNMGFTIYDSEEMIAEIMVERISTLKR